LRTQASRTRKSPSREKLKKNRAHASQAADLDSLGAAAYSSAPLREGATHVGSVIKKRRKKMRKHKKKKLLKRSRHKRK
jgi:hypothetical protein